MLRPFEEMERMFGEFLPRGLMHPSRWELPMMGEWLAQMERRVLPRVDIIERDAELVLKAQLPGVEKKDLNISMTDTMVTIEGTTSHESTTERGDYYRRECSHGSFSRSITLPCGVDSAKAKASFNNGILEMTLPKLVRTTRRSVHIA
ncbi:MAG TPA: Hsp20/alpha crystallin family protein [Mariprofundaceae bacterium]|nr:Hsp20/alpha crystallin family protein [Mariprofundaceae bacterium]